MDVFGNTTESERKQALTSLETNIGDIKNELHKINKLVNNQEKSIIILEEKIKLLTNQINSDLFTRLATLEVFFKNKINSEKTTREA